MLYQRAIVSSEPVDTEKLNQIDWYLSPTAFDGAWRWRHRNKVPELTSNDIMNRAEGFIAISKEIWDFAEKVRDTLKVPIR